MDLGEIYCPWKHIYKSVFEDEDSKPRDLVGQMRSLKKAPWNLTPSGGGIGFVRCFLVTLASAEMTVAP